MSGAPIIFRMAMNNLIVLFFKRIKTKIKLMLNQYVFDTTCSFKNWNNLDLEPTFETEGRIMFW